MCMSACMCVHACEGQTCHPSIVVHLSFGDAASQWDPWLTGLVRLAGTGDLPFSDSQVMGLQAQTTGLAFQKCRAVGLNSEAHTSRQAPNHLSHLSLQPPGPIFFTLALGEFSLSCVWFISTSVLYSDQPQFMKWSPNRNRKKTSLWSISAEDKAFHWGDHPDKSKEDFFFFKKKKSILTENFQTCILPFLLNLFFCLWRWEVFSDYILHCYHDQLLPPRKGFVMRTVSSCLRLSDRQLLWLYSLGCSEFVPVRISSATCIL